MALQNPQVDDRQAEKFPAPLEFLTKDFIHPDNEAIAKREKMRWRLLSRLERWKLRRYVATMARELNKAGYNQLVVERRQLHRAYRVALNEYKTTTYINDDARQQGRQRVMDIVTRAKAAKQSFDALKEKHALFDHYSGWLEYEEKHRKELKEEARRERKIRRDMRRETKWIEALIKDTWRITRGCHYIYKVDNGRERTKVPVIERRGYRADAHYMWIGASRRLPIIGWQVLLPRFVTTTRLAEPEVLANVSAALKGRQVDVVYSEQGQMGYRVSRLDHPDALPKNVKWRDAMRFYPEAQNDKLPYSIGVDAGRKFIWFKFGEDPNLLVAGKAQSGKSNLVNGIIATLVSTHSPAELRIVLIDQKGGMEFTHWVELPHLLWDMVKTVDQTFPTLERIVNILRHRMALLEQAKAKNIAAYNARVDVEHRLARILIVIDEMNTFVGLGERTEQIHNLIMLIVSQGRAVGVHVITSTQHPEVKVIPGRIKTNIGVRVSGAMPTISASQIVLDNPEAARLPSISGRMAAAVGLRQLVVQAPLITDEDIAGVVSAARVEHPDVANDLVDAKDQPQIVTWDEQRVIKSALEWFEGQLSGQKMHKTLGAESPGERHLTRICREIADRAEAVGYVEGTDGQRWKIRKDRKARYLEPLQPDDSDQTDSEKVLEKAESASD